MADLATEALKPLFHLVPESNEAHDALNHRDNSRFVSPSAEDDLGLEIGFHVPRQSGGYVITRLGRNTDLILRESPTTVHVAFHILKETMSVMLAVRAKNQTSVTVTSIPETGSSDQHAQEVIGDCAIFYGQNYFIAIDYYRFRLVWRLINGEIDKAGLQTLTEWGYHDSMRRAKELPSREVSQPEHSTNDSYYMTRLQSSKAPIVVEKAGGPRKKLGSGGFGEVQAATDAISGRPFAIKVVNLRSQKMDIQEARVRLHREIKILLKLKHPHIIPCFGFADFDTDSPVIYMPLCKGDLIALSQEFEGTSDDLCLLVLKQILAALDYLDSHGLCHRDVKPENILYDPGQLGPGQHRDEPHLQLADFGLANSMAAARTQCGTANYTAPEVVNGWRQSPKMDIWSLFATIAVIHPNFNFPPKPGQGFQSPLNLLQAAAANSPFEPMTRINPKYRASAAQMLVQLFGGEGLTTPARKVPPIGPEGPDLPGMPEPMDIDDPQVVVYARSPPPKQRKQGEMSWEYTGRT